MNPTPGYKHTEVGLIPKDWEVTKVGTVAQYITVGFVGSMSSLFVQHGVPLLRGQNVLPNALDLTNLKYISSQTHRQWKKSALEAGDVAVVRVGYPGTACVIPEGIGDVNAASLVIVRPSYDLLASDFLCYVLNSERGKAQVQSQIVGNAQQVFNTRTAANFVIPLPPLPEQRAIAAALSDMDALLRAQDAMLAKKRDLKTAAMQQLLAGKRRLPGFGGAWETKKLGDISKIKTGKRNNEEKIEDGLYPFFVRSQEVERINSYSFDGEAILIPGEGGIGSIFHYINGKFDYHQRVYKISDFDAETCGKFVYFSMMQNFHLQATRNSVKATVDSLRLPTFLEFELSLPQLEEQTAIAEVLSAMDAEIAAREAEREKTRALKIGAMQEMLSGRTRLR